MDLAERAVLVFIGLCELGFLAGIIKLAWCVWLLLKS
jgi:hypothetical protein